MKLLVIAILLSFTGAEGSKLEGPQNTLIVVGSNVTLKCSSPSRNCWGNDWQKYVSGASPMTVFKGPRTFLNVVDRDRYSVDNSSGCDLVIRNVQLTDAGRFICSAIMNSSQETRTAYLIILETPPNCTSNASVDNTAEGDGVQLKCEVKYNGTNRASMDWKGVENTFTAVQNGSTISRVYSAVASAPEVPSFTCEASFAYETAHDGRPIPGLATNRIPSATCSTSAVKVLYSARDVTLSPSYSNYPSGTTITCMAKGHPSPTFKWQENENNDVWMDIQNQIGSQFTTSNVSSKKYRCVTLNVVRGKNHSATSIEFQVNNTDRVAQHQDHEMSQRSGALIVGEQEAAYASLGEGRDANEYASLEKRLKSKTREKVGEQESTYAGLGVDREISEYASLEQGQKTETREKVKVLDQESAYASLGEDRGASEYASLEQRQKSKPKKKSKL